MNTRNMIFMVALSLVLIFSMVSCAAGLAATTASSPTGTTLATSTAANTVSIESFKFTPETLTIKTGTTVTWTNKDSVAHDIKSDSFNSPSLAQNQTFSFTFNDKGTFNYICGVHPSMKGKIIVE